MMNAPDFWIASLLLALGAFVQRFCFFFLEGRWEMPDGLRRGLRFIPPAALTALVTPMFLLHGENVLGISSWTRLLAGALAVLAAWKSRNILVVILVGLGSLWLLDWLSA
ncbi:AzlD domain-containing protein [Megalodesulfovibrio paquesii]